MKKFIALLVAMIMVLSVIPSYAEGDVSFSLNFDNLTSTDNLFILGGGYAGKNVTLSTEYDHTTGSGKSLKLSERTKEYHRIKFTNAITSDMQGKEITASMWVYTLEDSRLMLGAFSDTNTQYATNPIKSVKSDIKANTWTLLSFTFTPSNPIITQLGITQDNCGGIVTSTIYVDDVSVVLGKSAPTAPLNPTEPSNPSKPSEPAKPSEPTRTKNVIDFNDAKDAASLGIEGGGGAFASNFSISSDVAYDAGGTGKSLLFAGRTFTYARAKFMNVFDGLSMTQGTNYKISMMVMVANSSDVEAGQFNIGIINFLGAAGNGKEYYFGKDYKYTVKKGEWTKVELTYTNKGEELYGITLDQVFVSGVPHADVTVSDLYIDNVTVEVSDEIPKTQPTLTNDELIKLANLGVTVYIDNNKVIFSGDQAPVVISDRTLVPLRKIFEKLGASVYWDDATQTVTAKKGTKEIKLTIGSTTAYINGKETALDVGAQLINYRTMVPVRFIAESLDCKVDWDDKSQKVLVTSPESKNEINVYSDNVKQEIYGFGASANHNAYYLMESSEEMQKKTMDALFDKNTGIGLNIIRLEINPYTPKDASNFNPEFQYTINPEKDVWDMDADKHQIWYSNTALKINPNITFLATPWSPPSWMKENNSVVGKTEKKNILAKEHYNDYAEYLARWTKYYKNDLGFDVKWVSIQNEPDGSTPYASCEYSYADLLAVTKLVTEKFKNENIDALVGAPESSTQTSTNTFMKNFERLDPDFTKNGLELVLAHSYAYDKNALDTANLERFNKPLIQAERCESPSKKRENNGEKLLRYANEIADHLNHNYNAYLYWYGMRKSSNLGQQNSESLIDYNDESKKMMLNDEYYSLGHFSKFITPGDKRIAAYSENKDITVTSTINPETGKIVIVAVNNGESDVSVTVNGLSKSRLTSCVSTESEKLVSGEGADISNGSAVITLKAKSITTLVEE